MRLRGMRRGSRRARRDCCGNSGVGHRVHHNHHCVGSLQPGERAIIEHISCTGGFKRRLLSVGMAPGKEILCIRGKGRHGRCLRVGDSEYFVNSHMADQIHIRRNPESA